MHFDAGDFDAGAGDFEVAGDFGDNGDYCQAYLKTNDIVNVELDIFGKYIYKYNQ